MEVLLSIILNLAICASWDARNSDKLDSVSLKIGLLVAVLNLGGVSIRNLIGWNLASTFNIF